MISREKLKISLEYFLLSFVIIVIVGLFSIPIVVYYGIQDEGIANWRNILSDSNYNLTDCNNKTNFSRHRVSIMLGV